MSDTEKKLRVGVLRGDVAVIVYADGPSFV